jgi:ankyrin repeat protein
MPQPLEAAADTPAADGGASGEADAAAVIAPSHTESSDATAPAPLLVATALAELSADASAATPQPSRSFFAGVASAVGGMARQVLSAAGASSDAGAADADAAGANVVAGAAVADAASADASAAGAGVAVAKSDSKPKATEAKKKAKKPKDEPKTPEQQAQELAEQKAEQAEQKARDAAYKERQEEEQRRQDALRKQQAERVQKQREEAEKTSLRIESERKKRAEAEEQRLLDAEKQFLAKKERGRAERRTGAGDVIDALETLLTQARAAAATAGEERAAALALVAVIAAEKDYDAAARSLASVTRHTPEVERVADELAKAKKASAAAVAERAELERVHAATAAMEEMRARFADAYVAAAEAAAPLRKQAAALAAAQATVAAVEKAYVAAPEAAQASQLLTLQRSILAENKPLLAAAQAAAAGAAAADKSAHVGSLARRRGSWRASVTSSEAADAELARIKASNERAEMEVQRLTAVLKRTTPVARKALALLKLPADASPSALAGHASRLRAECAALEEQIARDAVANAARVAAVAVTDDSAVLVALGRVGRPDVDALRSSKDAWLSPKYGWTLARSQQMRDDFAHAAAAARGARSTAMAAALHAEQKATTALRKSERVAANKRNIDAHFSEVQMCDARHAEARLALLAAHGQSANASGFGNDLNLEMYTHGSHRIGAKALLRRNIDQRDAEARKAAASRTTAVAAAHKAFDAALHAVRSDDDAAADLARWAGLERGRSVRLPFGCKEALWRVAAPYERAPLAVLVAALAPLPDLAPILPKLLRALSCHAARAAHVFAAIGATPLLEEQLVRMAESLEARDDDDATPLLVALRARRTDVTEFLLARGADATAVDNASCGALHGLSFGDEALCETLLAAGADPALPDADGCTPLHAAAAACNVPLVRALLQDGRTLDTLTACDAAGCTPLHCALAQLGEAQHVAAVVRALLAPGAAERVMQLTDGKNRLPLDLASRALQPAAVCSALADALAAFADDEQKLQAAVRGCALHALAKAPGAHTLLRAALRLSGDACEAAKQRTDDGMMALHVAADAGATAALLEAFPDGVDAVADEHGRTALWYRCAANDAASVQLLLDAGAAFGDEVSDSAGRSPEDVAGEACKLLLQARQQAEEQKRELVRQALMQRGGVATSAPMAAPEQSMQLRAAAARALARSEADAYIAAAPAQRASSTALCAAEEAQAAPVAAPAVAVPFAAHDPRMRTLARLDAGSWEVQLSPKARRELFGLHGPLRTDAVRALSQLAGDGNFCGVQDQPSHRLTGKLFTLPVCAADAGGMQLVCELAVCFSARQGGAYTEIMRVWGVALREAVSDVLAGIAESLQCGQQAAFAVRVRPLGAARVARCPRKFVRLQEGAPHVVGELALKPPADMSVAGEPQLFTFTIANDALAHALLCRASDDGIDFARHVDEAEAHIVGLPFNESVLLLGRSGTGKTTVAVLRIWSLICAGTTRIAFVTKSRELCNFVRVMVRRLQRGAGMTVDDAADASAPVSLARCTSWPLLITSAVFLRLMDNECAKPFFPRTPEGALVCPARAPATWRAADAPAASGARAARVDVDFAEFRSTSGRSCAPRRASSAQRSRRTC